MLPKCRICLKPHDIIPGERGWDSKQLLKLLRVVSDLNSVNSWYAAHIHYVAKSPEIMQDFPSDGDPNPKLVGLVSKLIYWIERTEYFESGVFLGIQNFRSQHIEASEFWTEDDQWRDFQDAKIEIRAFDTSFYEIYSSDYSLLEFILARFPSSNVKIEENSS